MHGKRFVEEFRVFFPKFGPLFEEKPPFDFEYLWIRAEKFGIEHTLDLLDGVSIRTYERGDEMESLSCGTGSVATAIALYEIGKLDKTNLILKTTGGELTVSFNYDEKKYTNIWLSGEASMVYAGEFEC